MFHAVLHTGFTVEFSLSCDPFVLSKSVKESLKRQAHYFSILQDSFLNLILDTRCSIRDTQFSQESSLKSRSLTELCVPIKAVGISSALAIKMYLLSRMSLP